MASILRIPVSWNGITALPGVSVFYSASPSVAAVADLVTFFTAIRSYFPSGLSWEIPSSGDSIDDGNGALDGTWSGGAGAVVTSTGSGSYPAGVGARVRWRTAGIFGGRRVVGSTFLAPLTVSHFDASGTIQNTALAALQSAADTLAFNGNLDIWSRPSPTNPVGTSNVVTSAVVPDRVTALRSRRY